MRSRGPGGRASRGSFAEQCLLRFLQALGRPALAGSFRRCSLPFRQRPNCAVLGEQLMLRRRFLAAGGLSALGVPMLASLRSVSARDRSDRDDHDDTHRNHSEFQECAEICTECQRKCDECVRHCVEMLAQGSERHQKTLATCQDCADLCAAAARIVSRCGPFSREVCEACAEACSACAESCERFSNDDLMTQCADICRECEEQCNHMVRGSRRASR